MNWSGWPSVLHAILTLRHRIRQSEETTATPRCVAVAFSRIEKTESVKSRVVQTRSTYPHVSGAVLFVGRKEGNSVCRTTCGNIWTLR